MAQKKILSTDDLEGTPTEDLTTKTATSEYLFDWRALYNAHTVDLDAHTSNIYEQFLVGYYLPMPFGDYSADLILVQYTLYGTYIIVPRDMTFDRIAIDIEIADAGQDIRLGIYDCDSSLLPSDLVSDCGTVDTDSAALKTIVIDVSLTKGRYFLAAITDSNGIAKVVYSISHWGGLGISTNFERCYGGYTKAYAAPQFAALPDPFGATPTLSNGPAVISLRVASLD